MKNRLEHFQLLTDLFAFKTIADEKGNEYVVYRSSSPFEGAVSIDDKTAFEAVENHVHLLDDIKPKEFEPLIAIGSDLGKALLASLKFSYPDKYFYVFVEITLGDSFVIRFYQKWEDEPPYYDLPNLNSCPDTRIIMFEG